MTFAGPIGPNLLAWAASAFGSGAKIVEVRPLRKRNGPWALRVDQEGVISDAVLKCGPRGSRDEFRSEAAALAFAAEHELPAPRLLAVDLDGSAAGALAILMTGLPGTTDVPLVPTRERLRAIGAITARLHSVSLSPRPELPMRRRHMPWVDFAFERRWAVRYRSASHSDRAAVLEKMVDRSGWGSDEAKKIMLETPSTPLLEAADRALLQTPKMQADTVFVHGDLWQGNSVWDGDNCVGIIDWEAAGAGHYGVDLGSLRLDAAILFGEGFPDEILAGWEEASGRKAERVGYWDIVAAINTSADMAGFLPTIHEAGRLDLDGRTLTDRRDAFLRAALDQLDASLG